MEVQQYKNDEIIESGKKLTEISEELQKKAAKLKTKRTFFE